MGITFTSFLKQFRLSHAKRLLKGTDMKIYEIAKATGYNDIPNTFKGCLKRRPAYLQVDPANELGGINMKAMRSMIAVFHLCLAGCSVGSSEAVRDSRRREELVL